MSLDSSYRAVLDMNSAEIPVWEEAPQRFIFIL